jgi:hypothetical protein
MLVWEWNTRRVTMDPTSMSTEEAALLADKIEREVLAPNRHEPLVVGQVLAWALLNAPPGSPAWDVVHACTDRHDRAIAVQELIGAALAELL